MSTVHVAVPGSEYDVFIERGMLSDIGSRIRDITDAKTLALISDETVAGYYGIAVDTSLAQAGFDVSSFSVAPGEYSKNWHQAGDLLEAMAGSGLSRDSIVVALGGGVVGDLAGFVSATYLRGIDFVQVPTTLLAAVDSSVGGKTGVDLVAGKNLAGAIKQPLTVLLDPVLLGTLPPGEWLSGCAEIAKSAVLDGEEWLGWLEQHAAELADREPGITDESIARSVRFKAGVVARDERESGPRECLNYGHTLGHALEKVLGYGAISHGVAVAEGIRFAARVAVEVAGAEKGFARRQDRLLDALGLLPLETSVSPAALLEAMRHDKKARGGSVRFVLATAPGEWRCEAVPDQTILEHLQAWAATKGGE